MLNLEREREKQNNCLGGKGLLTKKTKHLCVWEREKEREREKAKQLFRGKGIFNFKKTKHLCMGYFHDS